DGRGLAWVLDPFDAPLDEPDEPAGACLGALALLLPVDPRDFFFLPAGGASSSTERRTLPALPATGPDGSTERTGFFAPDASASAASSAMDRSIQPCWAMLHRLVVTQYSKTPTGRL